MAEVTETDSPRAGAIILAAGAGTRLGIPKALVEFEGRLLVERAVETAVLGGCSIAVVVLGAASAEVRYRANLRNAHVVVNDGWAEGLGSSLRTGLAAIAGHGCDAAVVLLVDQPFIGAAAVQTLLDAWRDGARLAASSYMGRRDHPVLFGHEHWTAVANSAHGDTGARAYLAEHTAEIVTVPCDDVADPRDIDTPAQLREANSLADNSTRAHRAATINQTPPSSRLCR